MADPPATAFPIQIVITGRDGLKKLSTNGNLVGRLEVSLVQNGEVLFSTSPMISGTTFEMAEMKALEEAIAVLGNLSSLLRQELYKPTM